MGGKNVDHTFHSVNALLNSPGTVVRSFDGEATVAGDIDHKPGTELALKALMVTSVTN